MFLEYFDSHAHITSEAMYGRADEVIAKAKEAGVTKIVNICTDQLSLERGIELSKKYGEMIFNTASTTPHDVDREGEIFFPFVVEAAKNRSLVAIGETGLDYYYSHSERSTQKQFLRRYLRLALEYKLPVVIHCRDAFDDFFSILDEEYTVDGKCAPGVLHCFTGNIDEAREVIRRGWYLSLSGIVTFKKSVELREVAKIVPSDQLLIETDSPYLAPQKWRGKCNEPAYLVQTAEVIAEVKGVAKEVIAKTTRQNGERLFFPRLS